MKFRKLRIAWSVAWSVAVVLLCMLWVRSYFVCDYIFRQGSALVSTNSSNSPVTTTIAANRGTVHVLDSIISGGMPPAQTGWTYGRKKASDSHTIVIGFLTGGGGGPAIPFSQPILILAFIAVLSWLPWHFSLRTLLIAMTLVAVGLGLVMWAF